MASDSKLYKAIHQLTEQLNAAEKRRDEVTHRRIMEAALHEGELKRLRKKNFDLKNQLSAVEATPHECTKCELWKTRAEKAKRKLSDESHADEERQRKALRVEEDLHVALKGKEKAFRVARHAHSVASTELLMELTRVQEKYIATLKNHEAELKCMEDAYIRVQRERDFAQSEQQKTRSAEGELRTALAQRDAEANRVESELRAALARREGEVRRFEGEFRAALEQLVPSTAAPAAELAAAPADDNAAAEMASMPLRVAPEPVATGPGQFMFYIKLDGDDSFAYITAKPTTEFHKVFTALCQRKNIPATTIAGFQLPNGCVLAKGAIGMSTLDLLGVTSESVLTLLYIQTDARGGANARDAHLTRRL